MNDMTHIDWCIATEPEACEGECIAERINEIDYELAGIEKMLTDPEWDLTIETQTRIERDRDNLEDERRRLMI